MKKLFFITAILLSIVLFVCQNITAQVSKEYKYIDFDLPTISTFNIRLSEIVGKKLVLLNFWATWCPYCINEIPQLNSLYEKYKDKGLEIIAVNIKEPQKTVKKFVEVHKIKYNVVIDNDGVITSYYKIKGIPTNFIIDFNGNIIFVAHVLPKEELIENYLPKPQPPPSKNVKTIKTKTKTKK